MKFDDLIPFFSLSEDDIKKLVTFLKAKFCFDRAVNENSSEAYLEALQLAEQALRYQPNAPELHFIAGISRLRAWGDKEYGLKKYKLLMTLGPEGLEFADKLKSEIR